jgi:hypothetical protein
MKIRLFSYWDGDGVDRFCGIVVRGPVYKSKYLDSISGATRFYENTWVLNVVHSAS